jgi:uncharacterized iron-regulated membrane protein
MKRFRRVVFWLHLSAGSVAGLVIGIMAVTGVLLAFEPQILRMADGSVRRLPAPGEGGRLAAGELLSRVRRARPQDAPRDLTVFADPTAAASVSLGRDRALFVDPRDGTVLGDGSRRARAFFRVVTGWHRWLGAGEENGALPRAVTGACNAAFLVLAVSGLYLWWPREWTKRQLARIGWFEGGLAGKARDWNWHNAIGFWCAPVLIVLTASGMVISYPWASDLVYRIAGETPPPRRNAGPSSSRTPAPGTRPAQAARPGGDAPAWPDAATLDRFWERAARHSPGWQSLMIRAPRREGDAIAFTIREAGARSWQRSSLTLDGQTGEVEKWEPYSAATRGRKARLLLRFLHTGEAAGLFGQILAGLASLGGAFLVYTGLSLALRRFAAWTRGLARAGNGRARSPLVETPEDAA